MGHKKNFLRNRQGFDLNALIFYIQTDATGGTSANDQFTIPVGTGTYNYNVETSDGQSFTGQTTALTITFPSVGNYYISITGTFPKIFFNNSGDDGKLIKVINFGTISYNTDITGAFYGCQNLNELSALNGDYTFFNSALNGTSAIRSTSSLSTLSEGITFAALTNATSMFRLGELNSLPSTVTFANLTTGARAFESCQLTSLPSGITLNKLANGQFFFLSNSLTDLPAGFRLDKIAGSSSGGSGMFNGSTINTTRYSQLIRDLDTYNVNNTVGFGGGSSVHSKNQVDSGTTDGTTANKLVDSTQNFLTTVNIGDAVRNTTDSTWALVTNVDSDTQLTLGNDIMISGESYKIYDDATTKARANLEANRAWGMTDATTY